MEEAKHSPMYNRTTSRLQTTKSLCCSLLFIGLWLLKKLTVMTYAVYFGTKYYWNGLTSAYFVQIRQKYPAPAEFLPEPNFCRIWKKRPAGIRYSPSCYLFCKVTQCNQVTWFHRNSATLAALYADQTVKRNSRENASSRWHVMVQPLAISSSSSMNRHWDTTTTQSTSAVSPLTL